MWLKELARCRDIKKNSWMIKYVKLKNNFKDLLAHFKKLFILDSLKKTLFFLDEQISKNNYL